MPNNSNSSSKKDKDGEKSIPMNKITPGSEGIKWRQDTANFSEGNGSKKKIENKK